ncbi:MULTISPECIES: ABC transporter ATP-binding protein [Pelosinus]|uniref:Nickel import system ATP-binding protein NikD n=1 Tax=Pelosinus fermentans B4 TaxID=1149862 RepID=I9ART7_9FIRM|nr:MULTISPECIES: ABC transporter ATP-binding protein [Pelosinus]EIW15662.1 oligopeptide/dipeptide ABC transporter, ATPase subunit [Pelosinus fermentans B4]EIW26648.1 oligopeptide/dipeptide ABC transporter, ATPase subunit [Pelosinus fermentans A11]OAM92407.1 oligopeptide/dipeptide ABC transporter, ATPase subunit [Pelosinus fermentans DSM 17108]SDQ43837.1 peptide/nickel transport system ATP-binding protein [Pelosinus fermentans]
MSCMNHKYILQIKNLSVSFTQYENGLRKIDLKVIRNLNVSVGEGELVAVVGASGSGKSLLAHAILGILPQNCDAEGNIWFEDELLSPERIKELRGEKIVLVPQSVTYLDPLEKVGKQVRKEQNEKSVRKKQEELFAFYKLSQNTADLYPFELSGGMARRVLLTTAMMESPRLIIADEPTPGLHLEAAKKAMGHFREFADKGNGVLLITHDIELALEVADRIAVFYAGTTVEEAPVADFQSDDTLRHPYTKALWRALPQNGFHPFPGKQPYAKDMPNGCPFGPRCPQLTPECEGNIQEQLIRFGRVRCIHAK